MTKLIISEIDKANHFIVGTIICSLSILFMPAIDAFFTVVIAGTIKELYDLFSKTGTPDYKDLLFTIAGSLPVLISHL